MAKEKKEWQPKEWWPMECGSFEDFRDKLTNPPAGFKLHSWQRGPYEDLYVVLFRMKEPTP